MIMCSIWDILLTLEKDWYDLRKGCAHVFVSVTAVFCSVMINKRKSQALELQVVFALVLAITDTKW